MIFIWMRLLVLIRSYLSALGYSVLASEVRGFLQTKQFQEITAKVLKVNKSNNACMGLAGNRLFRVSISI